MGAPHACEPHVKHATRGLQQASQRQRPAWDSGAGSHPERMDFLAARHLPAQGARRPPGKHPNGVRPCPGRRTATTRERAPFTSPCGGKGPGTLNQHARSACYRNPGLWLPHARHTDMRDCDLRHLSCFQSPSAHLSGFCTWATAGLVAVPGYPFLTAANPQLPLLQNQGFTFPLFRNNVLPTAQLDGGVGDTLDQGGLGVPQTSDVWPHLGARRQQPPQASASTAASSLYVKNVPVKGPTCSLSTR